MLFRQVGNQAIHAGKLLFGFTSSLWAFPDCPPEVYSILMELQVSEPGEELL